MKWLNPKVCDFDGKVWVELGPQIIDMECNEANLKNEVTHANYRLGAIDAYGRLICENRSKLHTPDAKVVCYGEEMAVVDWEARHVPRVWKVYERQDGVFIKVFEDKDKNVSINKAKKILKEA
mgnify:CR=1 FL=1|tara:strand:+ start:1124 stop:1492 length:369 start_codon:yes stop_codon:yes gene_type:complete